jgi:hypothetical protein
MGWQSSLFAVAVTALLATSATHASVLRNQQSSVARRIATANFSTGEAAAAGKYYSDNIRSRPDGTHGPFDCRDHPLPEYR